MTHMIIKLAGTTTDPEVFFPAMSWLYLRARLDVARADQRGMTTETVIITAGLSALAVVIVALIARKVTRRAKKIR